MLANNNAKADDTADPVLDTDSGDTPTPDEALGYKHFHVELSYC